MEYYGVLGGTRWYASNSKPNKPKIIQSAESKLVGLFPTQVVYPVGFRSIKITYLELSGGEIDPSLGQKSWFQVIRHIWNESNWKKSSHKSWLKIQNHLGLRHSESRNASFSIDFIKIYIYIKRLDYSSHFTQWCDGCESETSTSPPVPNPRSSLLFSWELTMQMQPPMAMGGRT